MNKDELEESFRASLRLVGDDLYVLNNVMRNLYSSGAITDKVMDAYDEWSDIQ